MKSQALCQSHILRLKTPCTDPYFSRNAIYGTTTEGLFTRAVNSRPIYQKMALMITSSFTLDFSKLVDFKMASRNLSCLIKEKLPCLGKARVRLIKTTPNCLAKIRPTCKAHGVKKASSQRFQEVFTCF